MTTETIPLDSEYVDPAAKGGRMERIKKWGKANLLRLGGAALDGVKTSTIFSPSETGGHRLDFGKVVDVATGLLEDPRAAAKNIALDAAMGAWHGTKGEAATIASETIDAGINYYNSLPTFDTNTAYQAPAAPAPNTPSSQPRAASPVGRFS